MSTPTASPPASSSRRDRYLDVAMDLFTSHGFAGTSMDMIVAEVGGSKATLYKHFPSKDDLVEGLIDRASQTMTRASDDPATGELPLGEALTAIARSTCAGVWSPEAAAVLRLCLGEYHRFPQLARTVWEHGPAITYRRFHEFLAERQRRGDVVAIDDPQIVAEQFLAGLVAHQQLKIAFGLADSPSDAETEARVQSAVATFMARYAA